jgi:hypothetical protein
MCTQGYVVFKYKGTYYIFYNKHDSYLSNLGNIVVDDITKMINEKKIDIIKNKILEMPLFMDDDDFDGQENYYPGLYDAVDDPTYFSYYTSKKELSNTVFAEYIYLIDFDKEKFVIKMDNLDYDFELFNLPPNLIEILEKHESLSYDSFDSDEFEEE